MSERHRIALAALIEDPRPHLDSPDASIRRTAVAASLHHADVLPRLTSMLINDPDPSVRRECAEVLGLTGGTQAHVLETALSDDAAVVREAAITALGEVGAESSVGILVSHASDPEEDNLVREAAVAALGAIGDTAALPTLLDLIASGPPQVRRRCVAALSVFDGDVVDSALAAAADDRNPMVREAAEMVVGRVAE